MPTDAAQELRRILESELLPYEITVASTALVPYQGAHSQLRMYLASKQLEGLSLLTLERYDAHLQKFISAMQMPVEDITTMHIRAYLAAYQSSGVMLSTLNTLQSCLKSFFSWLEAEDLIIKSPMRKIRPIKTPSRKPKHLNASQMELLRMACRDLRDRAILETYYSTGCRVSELQKANYRQINSADGSLTVIGKGNKERTVYINDRAAVHLVKYLESRNDTDPSIFVRERKPYERMGVRAIQEVFTRLGETAGIEESIHPHLMRHTVATTMLRNGTDIAKIQRMLGHANPATTQIYADTDDAAVHDAHRRCS